MCLGQLWMAPDLSRIFRIFLRVIRGHSVFLQAARAGLVYLARPPVAAGWLGRETGHNERGRPATTEAETTTQRSRRRPATTTRGIDARSAPAAAKAAGTPGGVIDACSQAGSRSNGERACRRDVFFPDFARGFQILQTIFFQFPESGKVVENGTCPNGLSRGTMNGGDFGFAI